MKKSQGRIFTTHTGSLPRPDELVQLLAAVARGESVDQSALERLADASTLEVVRNPATIGPGRIKKAIVTAPIDRSDVCPIWGSPGTAIC